MGKRINKIQTQNEQTSWLTVLDTAFAYTTVCTMDVSGEYDYTTVYIC